MPAASLADCFDSFVVRTEPYRERWAAENCFRAGYQFYLPRIVEEVRIIKSGKRRKEFRAKPLFPGYLFVSAISGQWHTLLKTFGVIGVVQGSGGYPSVMRAPDLLRIRLFEGDDGMCQLPKDGFSPGDLARITQGAYAGYVGLIQGLSSSERIAILLDYMGRKVPFMVREGDLELAA